jgi:hypothetical protein
MSFYITILLGLIRDLEDASNRVDWVKVAEIADTIKSLAEDKLRHNQPPQ